MINWDELKHIHVIRRLEQLLSQWFKVEVFFVDEQGKVKNFDPMDRQKIFKNPLCAVLLPSEFSRNLILNHASKQSEKLLESKSPHEETFGPLLGETVYTSSILVDGEYLGSVYTIGYLKEDWKNRLQDIQTKVKEYKLDGELIAESFQKMHVMQEHEHKFFTEIVDLMAHEIETYHIEISKREERIYALNSQLGERYKYDSMIGKSKHMQALYNVLDKIKTSESSILIQGENGTGKELIARSIHFNSPRKNGQFVTLNCSAFNENLLDSELFGHVKGSFTGALRDKKGLFEVAHRGTLFLDEIGDMPLSMQVKLLRVLQEGTLIPVGGTDVKTVNVRVLAATNRDLKAMIEEGTFREDLYYRINVINLQVPPLRDRKEDLPLLIDFFLSKACEEKKVPIKNLAKQTFEKIFEYHWPGNIRELENEMERLVVLTGDEKTISSDMLSARIKDSLKNDDKNSHFKLSGKLKDALEELEKTMILDGLRRTRWNKSKLAKELGISRAGLIMKVEKYGLDKRHFTQKPNGGKAA